MSQTQLRRTRGFRSGCMRQTPSYVGSQGNYRFPHCASQSCSSCSGPRVVVSLTLAGQTRGTRLRLNASATRGIPTRIKGRKSYSASDISTKPILTMGYQETRALIDDQEKPEDHGQHQRGSNCIIKDLQTLRQVLQDMTDAQERECTRPCQERADRGNRGNPWKMNCKYVTEKRKQKAGESSRPL